MCGGVGGAERRGTSPTNPGFAKKSRGTTHTHIHTHTERERVGAAPERAYIALVLWSFKHTEQNFDIVVGAQQADKLVFEHLRLHMRIQAGGANESAGVHL